ncbi:hypothetical protein AAMO2058_001017200 [Amorphochlora amoebiformis]
MIPQPAPVSFNSEKPPPFSFEDKLEVGKLSVPEGSNLMQRVEDGEDSPVTPIEKEQKRESRTWSFVSEEHSLPTGSALLENRTSIPTHMQNGGKRNSTTEELRTIAFERKRDSMSKVTPELMAQMKKLESLQKPFRESDGMRMSVESTTSSSTPRLRGDSALFDEKQLEYVSQVRKQHNEMGIVRSSRVPSGVRNGGSNPQQNNNQECATQ